MPITAIETFITTAIEIDAHWTSVDADRESAGRPALTLPDGYARADLLMAIDSAQRSVARGKDLTNAKTMAITRRDATKARLRGRVIEFREAVRYHLPQTAYGQALPATPAVTSSEQKTLAACDEIEGIWRRINVDMSVANFQPPLILRGDFGLSDFCDELIALRSDYREVTDNQNARRIARRDRDLILLPLKARLVSYRKAIEVEYGPEHAFFTSLPLVYPKAAPAPRSVTLNGAWDPKAQAVALSWNRSEAPNLAAYEIRASRGESYSAATAVVIGNVPAGAPQLSFVTDRGLSHAAAAVSFKVFVKLTGGKETGSNTVVIRRPPD